MTQDVYQESYYNSPQPMTMNKEKQKEGIIQDEKGFLYKPYIISFEPSKLKTPTLVFITDKVDNLEMALKAL